MLWDNIVYVLVSMLIAVFCSLYVNKAGSFVDTVVNSCENGAPMRDGCDCTGLPFTGKNCQTSTCVHGWGVYDLDSPHTMNRPDAESLWACYCTDKWSGYNCERCNAKDNTKDECTGDCEEGYFGPHCQNTCFANLTELTRYSSETKSCADTEANGGTCNYCSGNGRCNDAGTCQCNKGYFDYKSGNEVHGCSLECPQHNGTFCSGAGECESTDLTVNCNCRPGYAGVACQYACTNQCSGIGACVVSNSSAHCSCPDRTRGDHCQYTCPGLSVCSGRGTCNVTGECVCDPEWEGEACNCQKNTTCSGHGTCQFNGTCACDPRWDCTVNKCVDGWYGSECAVQCTASGTCNGHGACDQSGACKCDSGWAGGTCNECEKDVFPKPGLGVEACLIYITEETCHHGYPNYMYGKSSRFSGMCICHPHFDEASNCDRCVSNWYGDNCDQFCDDDECYKGRCSDQGTCICEDGWFGEKCDSSCGGDGVCSGHGTCVKDEWILKLKQKCLCDEGYVGMDCDISAPMSSGSICNGRGAAVVTQVDHTGITFDCTGDVDCGDFSGNPDFTNSTMPVAMQMAFTQAVFGVLGPEQPYGPVCSLSKSPVSLIATPGSVGEHGMTEWSLDDITDGPFYIDTPDGFVYPLFRTKRQGFFEENATDIDSVVFYGDFTKKPTVQCEHLRKNEAELAGCTWLETGFCDYAMQNIDAADWCYRKDQYGTKKCADLQALACHTNNCSIDCGNYIDKETAIDQWNSKHIRTPFDGEDLINHAFVVTEDMYWGDVPNYNITEDCERVRTWDIPTRVYPSPRWWCQHGDTLSIVHHSESPSDDCQEIDKTVADFEGFSVRGVQYDTFQEAVSNLNYPDTIVYGKNHEYAETMSIDDMCRYYNSSFEETWVSDGVGAFNGTYYSLEYSFTLLDFSLGTTVAFVNETVNNTNYLAMKHGRRLQMIGGLHGTQVTTGPELELDTVYRIRLDFGDNNVTCEDLEGYPFSCPAPVDVGSGLAGMRAGMRAVERGGTHVFAMHAYYKGKLSFNDTVSKTDSWRLRMPPGLTADKSIWKLCDERHGVLVRSKSLCHELEALHTHAQSDLTRQETLDCVRRLESCPLTKLQETCDAWERMDKPNSSMCEDPGSNPTGYSACDSDWTSWCTKLQNDKLTGKCALMQCECNMDTYLGIAGSACQLSCPVNSDTGTACGYQEPPAYPYGKCKEIPSTGTSTVTPSTCECTRSLSESCEEKCDDKDTPDCNPTYSTETMRSFDIWGFGSEVSYEHRLSLVSYQKCTEYLQHHPASKVVKYDGTGLCRWTPNSITWGSDTGDLIDTLVTSKEECQALNDRMGLYKTDKDGSAGDHAGESTSDGIVFADGIVMKPTGSVGSEDRLYDIEFLGDASKLDMVKGSKVVIGTVVTVHSPTQVWSGTDISEKKTLVYGGSNGEYTLNSTHDLWRFKTDVVVPRGAMLNKREVYETSNGYMYTLGQPTTGNIEVPLTGESNELAGFVLELDSPVESAWVNGYPVTSYGNRIYSENLTNMNSVTVWTGEMFTLTDVTDESATRVTGVIMKMGDKLGESIVVLDNVVNGTIDDNSYSWYSRILQTEILNATTDGKICDVPCVPCDERTENIGMLLTQENSTGLIYNKTGMVFQIFTTDDWNGNCTNLTKITISDPLVTEYQAELHQGNQKGKVWDGAGYTLTVVGDFTTGPCNFFQPAATVLVTCIPTHVVNATASVPVVGGIMQGSSEATINATVTTEGTNILFESEQSWTNGLAVMGEITTVSCIASPVHLVKFESIYIVGSSEKILDPLNGSVDELHIVDYTEAKLTIEVDVAPVDTGLKVFIFDTTGTAGTAVNVGDVARKGNLVGVVSNTDPLEIESDEFTSGSITFGSPMDVDVTVTPANDILDIRGTVSDTWCSKINGVHVWGGDNLAQRTGTLTGTCGTVLDYHPATEITGSGEGCSYSNTEIVRGSNIGNDIRALVTSKEECRGYLDYHPAVTLLDTADTGDAICSFNDTHVSWGSMLVNGTVMGMPTGTVHLGISQCQGGICMCKPPNNAYFYKSRTSITGRTVKIRQTKYFGRHKGTNFMQGPQPYLINHAKYNNEPITEENWEAMYDVWITSKSGFMCSNPTYAKLGEACDYNTICIDAVCGTGWTCAAEGIDKYTGDYTYEQCLVDSLLLSERQDTSAYMGLLCQEECPSITEYGTPCSGHGTCARSGACTCEVARTMVKYTQNTRQIIKNEAGKPLISFTGQDSLKMEERTGWRGDGCELMCPGYDAFEADMTGICSGHGQCTADAKCTCEIGYTGENCQLDCPNTKKLKVQCSGHGVCQPNTFKATSNISAQLTNWICTETEQTLNTITINGHTVSELQFYENVESTSTEYMDADGNNFTVDTKKITPSIMLEKDKKYPVRIVGSDVTLVHDEFPRVGPNCESTMITNQYKIRPQIDITRYNDEGGTSTCKANKEVNQTCDVMSNDTLQCAMCACPPTMYNGFWGGSDCRTCMPGYGGTHCKDSCPGFDGTDIKTACGGIGTCMWGSTRGEGTSFKAPTCVCGDNPHAAPGYEYCDLHVDGNQDVFYNTIQTGECTIAMTLEECQTALAYIRNIDPSYSTDVVVSASTPQGCSMSSMSSMSGKTVSYNPSSNSDCSIQNKCMCKSEYIQNGQDEDETCSCKKGYSGFKCDQPTPTCLFGGTVAGVQCNCTDTRLLDGQQNCCPQGLKSTGVLATRELPAYITDSMVFTTWELMLDRTKEYAELCVANIPLPNHFIEIENAYPSETNRVQASNFGADGCKTELSVNPVLCKQKCIKEPTCNAVFVHATSGTCCYFKSWDNDNLGGTPSTMCPSNYPIAYGGRSGYINQYFITNNIQNHQRGFGKPGIHNRCCTENKFFKDYDVTGNPQFTTTTLLDYPARRWNAGYDNEFDEAEYDVGCWGKGGTELAHHVLTQYMTWDDIQINNVACKSPPCIDYKTTSVQGIFYIADGVTPVAQVWDYIARETPPKFKECVNGNFTNGECACDDDWFNTFCSCEIGTPTTHKYINLTSGTCESEGYQPIKTPAVCKAAAQALGITNGKDINSTGVVDYPQDCYLSDSLHFNPTPSVTPITDGQIICYNNMFMQEFVCSSEEGCGDYRCACLAGKFGTTTCTNCTAGKYRGIYDNLYDDIYDDFPTECNDCPAGLYANAEGSAECDVCAAGMYQDQKGKIGCKDCAAGSITDTGTMPGATLCTSCTPGKYSTSSAVASCTDCTAGGFAVNSDQNACEICASGKREKDNVCTDCSAGKYQSQEGKQNCFMCGSGQKEVNHVCIDCPEGYAQSEPGMASCTMCAQIQVVDTSYSNYGEITSEDNSHSPAGHSHCVYCNVGSGSYHKPIPYVPNCHWTNTYRPRMKDGVCVGPMYSTHWGADKETYWVDGGYDTFYSGSSNACKYGYTRQSGGELIGQWGWEYSTRKNWRLVGYKKVCVSASIQLAPPTSDCTLDKCAALCAGIDGCIYFGFNVIQDGSGLYVSSSNRCVWYPGVTEDGDGCDMEDGHSYQYWWLSLFHI